MKVKKPSKILYGALSEELFLFAFHYLNFVFESASSSINKIDSNNKS
jgi:hypothetical protein